MENEVTGSSSRKRWRKWPILAGVAGTYIVLWIITAILGCPQIKDELKPAQRPSEVKIVSSNPDVAMTADRNNNVTMNYVSTASPAPFIVVATFHDMRLHADAFNGSTSSSTKTSTSYWWLFGLHGRL